VIRSFSQQPAKTIAKVQIALEPVRNALISLSLLGSGAEGSNAHPWVVQTSAQLSAIDKIRQELIFGPFASVLLLDPLPLPATFPDYLEALANRPSAEWQLNVDRANLAGITDAARETALAWIADPATLKADVVAHLRQLWDRHLGPEWQKETPILKGLMTAVQWRIVDQPEWWANRSAVEALQAWLRRDVPPSLISQLEGAAQIIFVLSPHADLVVSRFGSPDTVWVFNRFDKQLMRLEPIRRAEILGGLTALADDNRLRIIELLAEHEELRAQDIVEKMTITQPNVSRHLKQLVSVGYVEERRVGDANKWYRLKRATFDETFQKLSTLLSPSNARAVSEAEDAAAVLRAAQAAAPAAVRHLINRDGRVRWPTKQSDQKAVVDFVATRFEIGRDYTEKEVNALIQAHFDDKDHVGLRRALFESGHLNRTPDGARYWRDK